MILKLDDLADDPFGFDPRNRRHRYPAPCLQWKPILALCVGTGFRCVLPEEPGAVFPHAGICGGAPGETGVPNSIGMKIHLFVVLLLLTFVGQILAVPSSDQIESFKQRAEEAIDSSNSELIQNLHYTKDVCDYQIDCSVERLLSYGPKRHVISVRFLSVEEYDRLRDPRTELSTDTGKPSGSAWHKPTKINGKIYVTNLKVQGYFAIKFSKNEADISLETFLPVGLGPDGQLRVPLLIRNGVKKSDF